VNLSPRQLQRRERILSTVREALSRGGYEHLSMREVASASGVSPTTLYNLYQNKDGLILAALQDLLAQIAASVPADLRGIDRLLALSSASSGQIMQTPRYAEAMARMLFNSAPTDPIAEALLHSTIDDHRILLEQMQHLGELRDDVDLLVFARNLSANRWATLLLWMQGHIESRDLEREYLRCDLLTLIPVMTAATSRKYLDNCIGREN